MAKRSKAPEEWTVANFVRVLQERFGIVKSARTIYRWIKVGAKLQNGSTRILGSKEIGGVVYVTLADWNQFRS